MTVLDKINVYFGTEFKNISEFIKDYKEGDLSDDYEEDHDKVIHLLMFLNALSREDDIQTS